MHSTHLQIQKTFTPEDIKKCFFVDFEVPENVEVMRITHTWSPREQGNLDFGLVGPDGKQVGATGNVTQDVTISEKYATPGYKKCTPKAGTWKIIIATDRVGNGVTASYDVEFQFKERRWMRGDTHMHTIHSDGKCTPYQLIEKAKRKKMDYIIITDHNNNTAAEENYNDREVLVIKGMELTSFLGHMNLWGVKEPFDIPYCINNYDNFLRVHSLAQKSGAVISMNHPECKMCGWHLPREGYHLDCVEVWNGVQRVDNMNNLAFWHSQLLKGRKLSAVGGSDYHRDYYVTDIFAVPMTYVCAESCTSSAILDALQKGHAFVTSGRKGPKIFLTCGDKMQGDSLSFTPKQKVNVAVQGLHRNDRLLVFGNDELLYEYKANRKGDYETEVEVKEKGFVRAQVVTDYGFLRAPIYKFAIGFIFPAEKGEPLPAFAKCISNPIYFD